MNTDLFSSPAIWTILPRKLRLLLCVSLFMPVTKAGAQSALDFYGTTVDGPVFHLADTLAAGKTVLLDFFYADCTPCKTYTPMLEDAYQYYQDSGVVFVAISDRDSNHIVEQFEQTYGGSYPSIGVEGGGDTITQLYKLWFPFLAWPTYAVICPDQTVNWDIPRSSGIPKVYEAISACAGISAVVAVANPSISVFPNPVASMFSVSSQERMEQMSLFSLEGQRLRTWWHTTDADIRDLAAGTYILEVTTASGRQSTLIQKTPQ